MATNREIAERFVRGATSGKGSNVFIDGDAIYSYGYHFPMAVRTSKGYLYNKDKYSKTTSAHQSYVRGAIGDKIVKRLDTTSLNKAIEKHRTRRMRKDVGLNKKLAKKEFG